MIHGSGSRTTAIVALLAALVCPQPASRAGDPPSAGPDRQGRAWPQLVLEAGRLGLPTGFLRRMPPDFVTITFEDLRSFAAEYHPPQHRMVLNRSLSLNAAGGTLRPLDALTHRNVATLYHELFHAYLDFLVSTADRLREGEPASRLLALARRQQACRYRQVLITPIRQRPSQTEMRFLTEAESWEALNETWAVFVEWAIWARLHLRDQLPAGEELTAGWLRLLKEADRTGRLVGFYEPADPRERELTHKRYLGPSYRITPQEVALLLETVLGESQEAAARAAATMRRPDPPLPPLPGCESEREGEGEG